MAPPGVAAGGRSVGFTDWLAPMLDVHPPD
jgi:hypothetical protein